MSLKFIPISGTTGVTENCYIYEYNDSMMILDCGVGFPEPEMFGVDLVIPDFTYVRENLHKLKGIVISHGHEDHIGALPFLLKDIQAPIYCTKLVEAFINDKFEDYGQNKPKINVFDPEKDVIDLGAFKVTPFRVSHSVPDAVGFCIDTPEGKCFHVPDYKFDWTPVDGKPFDIGKASLLAQGGVLSMASDCLGSTAPGHTESEKEIETRIQAIFEEAKGVIYFTTISSNISRMQQCLNVAKNLGRQVCFVGRSIDKKAAAAKRLGYLHYPNNLVVSHKVAKRLPREKIVYVISGSYGQPGSALYRVSIGEHPFLDIKQTDVVVFSADPAPPGSKSSVDFVVDRLMEMGIDVHYYDLQDDLHVSGHGMMEDIKMLFAIVKPQYCIPIGGTIRHMRAYAQISKDMGLKDGACFELKPGQVLELKKDNAKVVGKIQVRGVLVDGLGVGDVGSVVLRDRQALSTDGVVIVLIETDHENNKLTTDPEVISRGFVYEQREKKLLETAASRLRIYIEKRQKMDKRIVKDEAIDFLEKFFFEKTGRRPMIIPVIV